MLIRAATDDDIPDMAYVAADANVNDPLDAYFYSHRFAHPASYRKAYIKTITRMFQARGNLYPIVAVLEAGDAEYDVAPGIVGFSVWQRVCVTEDPHEHQHAKERTLAHSIKSAVAPIRCLFTILANQAASRRATLRAGFEQWFPCCQSTSFNYHNGPYQMPSDFFRCREIAVEPRFQRRGIGEKMMRYGMEMARGAGVPLFLRASAVGAPLYRRLGFESIGWWRCNLAEGLERELMRWDPPARAEESEEQKCGRERT